MADEIDPPRKFYGLKPREFERANPASEAASRPVKDATPAGEIVADPGPSEAAELPIDTRDLARTGAADVPTLSGNIAPVRDNEIHAMLRENVARETAAGLNELAPKKRRRSRRMRDYLFTLAVVNGTLAVMVASVGPTVVSVLFGLGGMMFFTTAWTWVMFVILDDY